LLGSFAALWFVIKYLETKEFKNYLFAIITYFLALLSKENAITFLAVIPLSIYFFTNNKVKENLQASSSLIIPVIVYLFIRQTITGGTSNEITDIMNNSFFGVTFSQKYGTILYTLGLYIKLLIFPHPLTYDYYPYHIPLINLDDLRAMIPLLIYIGLLYYAYIGFKKKDIMSFSILYYLCTLSIVSNIFFSIGIFMNERFIFTSSIAFCLIIAYLLIYKLPEIIKTPKVYQTTLITFLLIILSLYSYKTISRNKDWKDDRTLNFADVKTSDNSAKGNATVGFLYMEEADTTKDTVQRKELFERAIVHYKKAIEIHPTYVNTMINLGATYYKYKLDSKKTIYWYAKALQLNSKYENVYKSLQTLLDMIQNTPENIDYKIGVLNNLYKIYPDRYEINYKLGAFYQMKNDQKMSQYFLERASKLNPDNMNQPIIK